MYLFDAFGCKRELRFARVLSVDRPLGLACIVGVSFYRLRVSEENVYRDERYTLSAFLRSYRTFSISKIETRILWNNTLHTSKAEEYILRNVGLDDWPLGPRSSLGEVNFYPRR